MQELRVIGVESGALLLADEAGSQYRVAVDDVLQARMRQTTPDVGSGRKLAPRDIQAQIRAGLSAEDVAALTGAAIDYVRRFEGPVIAEREYVVQSALAVPVKTLGEADPFAPKPTFGDVIRGRLIELSALDERWASWKEQGGGWVLKLTFTADRVDHDARWTFDPKRSALAPLNSEAEALSRVGDLPAQLIPRLRAVTLDDTAPHQPLARFDSDAFDLDAEELAPAALAPVETISQRREHTDEGFEYQPNQTADLLEALRRRRGQRERFDPEMEAELTIVESTTVVSLIDIPLHTTGDESAAVETLPVPEPVIHAAQANQGKGGRKGRATIPSWDDIVFGARSDDD